MDELASPDDRHLADLFQPGDPRLDEIALAWPRLFPSHRNLLRTQIVGALHFTRSLQEAIRVAADSPVGGTVDPLSLSGDELRSVEALKAVAEAVRSAVVAMDERGDHLAAVGVEIEARRTEMLASTRDLALKGLQDYQDFAAGLEPSPESADLAALLGIEALRSAQRSKEIMELSAQFYDQLARLVRALRRATVRQRRRLQRSEWVRRLEARLLEALVGLVLGGLAVGWAIGWVEARVLIVGIGLDVATYILLRSSVEPRLNEFIGVRRIAHLRRSIGLISEIHRDSFFTSIVLAPQKPSR